MKNRMAMLAAAGALVGFLGFSGISLASAQDSSTTTPSTTAPSSSDSGSSSTAPADRPGCHRDGTTDGTGDLEQAPTPAPSSTTTDT